MTSSHPELELVRQAAVKSSLPMQEQVWRSLKKQEQQVLAWSSLMMPELQELAWSSLMMPEQQGLDENILKRLKPSQYRD